MTAPLGAGVPLITPCATLEEWRKLRGSYIGGSDAAAILGLSPYRTIGEVWIEKIRAQEALDAGEESLDPEMENRFTRWGKRWEATVLDEYQDVTGFQVRRPGLTLYRHPELPFIGGTLDGDVTTDFGDKRIVEAKTTDAWYQWRNQVWGPSGSDQVPDWYLVQLLVYLIVRRHEGFTVGDFAVLIGGNDFRIFNIPFDQTLADIIIDRLTQFWKLVQTRTAPPFDYDHKNAVELQRRIWNRVEEGSIVTVPPDYRISPLAPTIADLIIERDDATTMKEEGEARLNAINAQLLHIAGNNARVEIEGTGNPPLALRRQQRDGHHVEAYDTKPYVQLDVVVGNNNRREKRKDILNEFRQRQITSGE